MLLTINTFTHTHALTHIRIVRTTEGLAYKKSHSNLLAFLLTDTDKAQLEQCKLHRWRDSHTHTHTLTHRHTNTHTETYIDTHSGISNLVFTTFFCVAFLFRTRTQLLIKQPHTSIQLALAHTHTHSCIVVVKMHCSCCAAASLSWQLAVGFIFYILGVFKESEQGLGGHGALRGFI